MREKLEKLVQRLGLIGMLRIYGALIVLCIIIAVVFDVKTDILRFYIPIGNSAIGKFVIWTMFILYNIAVWKPSYQSYRTIRWIFMVKMFAIALVVIMNFLNGMMDNCGEVGISRNFVWIHTLLILLLCWTRNVYFKLRAESYMQGKVEKKEKKPEDKIEKKSNLESEVNHISNEENEEKTEDSAKENTTIGMNNEKKTLLRKIGLIGFLRIYGAVTLVVMLYWITSDIELNCIDMTLVPMLCYVTTETYLTKKITILFVPVLFNVALWIKTYKSYLIVKSILLIELTRLLILISLYVVFGLLAGLLGRETMPINVNIGFLLLLVSFVFLKKAFKNLKKSDYMKCILEKRKEEEEIEIDIMKTLITIISVFSIMLSTEIIIENRSYGGRVEIYKWGDGTYCEDVSLDGKNLLVVMQTKREDGDYREDVYIYDSLKKEKIKKLFTDAYPLRHYYFTPDGQNIIFYKDRRDEGIVRFAMFNIETGEIDHRFDQSAQNLSVKQCLIRESAFSSDGKYFVVLDDDNIQIWNYNTGELSLIKKKQYAFGSIEWISDEKLIVETGREKDGVHSEEIYLYKINGSGGLNYEKKEKIAESIREKRQEMCVGGRLWIRNLGDGKRVAIIVSGKTKTAYYQRNYIEIWDVESEEKLMSNKSYNLIKNVMYGQKNKVLITIDEIRSNRNKVRFFNTDTGDWEKKILLLKPDLGWNPVVSKDGRKILLKGNGYYVVHME